MAKILLLRTANDEVFRTKKLQYREPGFSGDLEKFYVGGLATSHHIPNETYVGTMISTALSGFGPKTYTTAQIEANELDKVLAYDNTKNRVVYVESGVGKSIAMVSDLPRGDAATISVAAENISGTDGSVLLTEFRRPSRMIFVDGILCANNTTSEKRYAFDLTAKEVKVFGCVSGSVISYF